MFDSTATVVSAMLLSPLMDPLIGMIFGTAIFDKRLFIRGTWYFTIGSLFVLFIGFCFGLAFSPWSDDLDWPTPEMETRFGVWEGRGERGREWEGGRWGRGVERGVSGGEFFFFFVFFFLFDL